MPLIPAVFATLGEVERPIPPETTGHFSADGTVIDPDSLMNILRRLAARDLAALAMTCTAMREAAASTYPGIKLRLYPHQRASLAFLLQCESDPKRRGGVLADEPGTGKTVTMLALLCKTAGMRSTPPPDALQLRRDAAEREWEHLAHAFKRELVFTVLKTIRLACPHAFAIFEKGGAEAAQALPRYRELVPEPRAPSGTGCRRPR